MQQYKEITASHQAISPWMDTEKAADYIGCKPNTLKAWRNRGEGPRYHVILHKLVRYHRDDLDAFIREPK